ncbi:hypothetical protein RIT80_11115, partial [Streptococcus pneumoniae]|nr:hypothetical protein [Streptococcus pneumoniae]
GFKHTHAITLLKTWLDFTHIGQLVRYPFMAINTGLPIFHRLVMHLRGNRFLGGCIHILEVVTVTALLRVIVLHAPPLILCHRQTMSFKFLRRVNNAKTTLPRWQSWKALMKSLKPITQPATTASL